MFNVFMSEDYFSNLIAILTAVFQCIVYNKMGIDWWKALIPIYNLFVLADKLIDRKTAKIVTGLQIAIYTLAIGLVVLLVPTYIVSVYESSKMGRYTTLFTIPIILLMAFAVMVATINYLVYFIKITHAVSLKFSHDSVFTVGLIILPAIFYGILALSDRETSKEEIG